MKRSGGIIIWLLAFVMIIASVPTVSAQEGKKSLSEEDYAQAEKFLRQHTGSLVFGTTVSPNWMGEDLFWYRNNIPEGYEFILVDMKKEKRSRAFDHQKLCPGPILRSRGNLRTIQTAISGYRVFRG